MENDLDRLRTQVTATMKRGTDLLADLVAGLTTTDGAAAWRRQHLERLGAGEAEEAA
jgi:hypothetical protein